VVEVVEVVEVDRRTVGFGLEVVEAVEAL